MSKVDIKENLNKVMERIRKASALRPQEFQHFEPRLVAVAKTHPATSILEAYQAGQRHFGENYVRELSEKGIQLQQLCPDIKWHFIGHLQSNKINKVLAVPGLYVVETVDSDKLAWLLNNAWPKFGPPNSKLRVMVQVNTSGEAAKSGVMNDDVAKLTEYILNECPNLHLDGFMTIGKYDYVHIEGPDPDFTSLLKYRNDLAHLATKEEFHLSMGMSQCFEKAIQQGSTSVRVGTAIFGPRQRSIII